MRRKLGVFMHGLSLTMAATAAAQMPAKGAADLTGPMRVAVTRPPGEPIDIVARVVGQKPTGARSQAAIIDSRAA